MNIIDRFVEQHYQIISLCEELKLHATVDSLNEDVDLAHKVQLKLNETLGLHLRLEDHSLYPMLSEHKDPDVRNTALRLKDEIESATLAHAEYQKKYASQQSIKDNISDYAQETQALVALIRTRIQKEEAELYSLLR